VDQAIADLSESVDAFLRDVHNGAVADARADAELHLRRLREFVRSTGVELNQVPAWTRSVSSWRAVARIAAAEDRRRTPGRERLNAG